MEQNQDENMVPVLQLCHSDPKFLEMLALFEKDLPGLVATDFFQLQVNSVFSSFKTSNLKNIHLYSVLQFYFARKGPKNRRFGNRFIGFINKGKGSPSGVFFNRPHVLSICNFLLCNENNETKLITDYGLDKIWNFLDKNYKLHKSEESREFFGSLKFDVSSVLPEIANSSSALSRSLKARKCTKVNASKRSIESVSGCKSYRKRPKTVPSPVAGTTSRTKRKESGDYKYVYRSTLARQVSRIKALKLSVKGTETKLSAKVAEVIVLESQVKNLQKKCNNLLEKFDDLTSVHAKVCKSNLELTGQIKQAKSELEYITDKLLTLEDLQNDLNNVEDTLNDPNFELESEIDKIIDDFEAGKIFPQLEARFSAKKINPAINLGIILIRQIGRVSLDNTMPLFVAIANNVFGQKWDLGNSVSKSRKRQTLPPSNSDSSKKVEKKPITKFTVPSQSMIRSLEKNFLEPAALQSTAAAIKNANVGSLIFDHLSIKRGKAITVGVMTGNIDPETKEKKCQHMTLAVKQVVDTTAPGTFRSVIEVLRLAAAADAASGSADDVQKSFKDLLSKLMFQVTDDASQMRPVCDKLNELIKLLGIDGEMVFIHCNAHIVPALDTGVTKVLIKIENFLEISDQMVRSFNQSFHKVSNSTIETMVRAIFKFVGDSVKNQSWAMTNEFQTFLDIIAEDGDKNFFKNPDSSKFGLFQEMCFILTYSFDNVSQFINRVYAGNNMYKSCELYIQCPYFRECLLSVTLLFYHVTSPFLVAVGAETQYGFCNLSHSELLVFFPKYVECLQSLTEDSSPFLSQTRLSFLDGFDKISNISKKKYREMFQTIFNRMNSDWDINLEIVKTNLKLLSEEYLIVIDRQAKEFYIGENSVVAQQLAKHEDIIDLVATTSLSAEHSVGITRQDLKRAPTALLSTLSVGQTFKSSPFGREILQGEMTPEKLDKIMKDTRKSGAHKLKKELATVDATVHRSEKQAQFAKLEAERRKVIQKKIDIAAAVKNHGGPLQSPDEVDAILEKYAGQPDIQANIVKLELKYNKIVICNNSVPDTRYREKTLNKATGKFEKLSLNERTANLKAIVSPIDQNTKFKVVNPDVYCGRANDELNVMQTYSHRTALDSIVQSDNQHLSFDDPFFNVLHDQSIIAVYCIEEAEIWYPAKIISVNDNKDCPDCCPLAIFHGDYPYCFMVQFMAKADNTNAYVLETPKYHVPASQVIACLPKFALKAGKARRSKINFIINNCDEILSALDSNILYAYRKVADSQQ